MPRGHKKNGAIPESEEDGTKGGSLSSDVSIFFKEIEGSGGNGHGPSAQAQNGNGGNAPVPADDRVTALETEAIQMFIAVARLLGYPRSVGEIFGILFAAEKPLTFEGISRKRGISAGSVSIGLRHLRSLGVVVATPVAGDRRDYFTVNDDFGRVNASLIRHHIEPRVTAARRKIDRIKTMADELAQSGPHGDLAARLQRFADWQSQLMRGIAPLLKTQ
jgi:DNA-binding transcriptional regulator GbsR (MarR family)